DRPAVSYGEASRYDDRIRDAVAESFDCFDACIAGSHALVVGHLRFARALVQSVYLRLRGGTGELPVDGYLARVVRGQGAGAHDEGERDHQDMDMAMLVHTYKCVHAMCPCVGPLASATWPGPLGERTRV